MDEPKIKVGMLVAVRAVESPNDWLAPYEDRVYRVEKIVEGGGIRVQGVPGTFLPSMLESLVFKPGDRVRLMEPREGDAQHKCAFDPAWRFSHEGLDAANERVFTVAETRPCRCVTLSPSLGGTPSTWFSTPPTWLRRVETNDGTAAVTKTVRLENERDEARSLACAQRDEAQSQDFERPRLLARILDVAAERDAAICQRDEARVQSAFLQKRIEVIARDTSRVERELTEARASVELPKTRVDFAELLCDFILPATTVTSRGVVKVPAASMICVRRVEGDPASDVVIHNRGLIPAHVRLVVAPEEETPLWARLADRGAAFWVFLGDAWSRSFDRGVKARTWVARWRKQAFVFGVWAGIASIAFVGYREGRERGRAEAVAPVATRTRPRPSTGVW